MNGVATKIDGVDASRGQGEAVPAEPFGCVMVMNGSLSREMFVFRARAGRVLKHHATLSSLSGRSDFPPLSLRSALRPGRQAITAWSWVWPWAR